jgi:hypothetical protein
VEGKIGWCMAEATATGAVLKFGIELSFVQGAELPISATGWLKAPHNVLLCPLIQVPVDQDADAPLRGSDGYASNAEKMTRQVWLIAALGRAELEHLADLRGKDAKGDVHLTLQIGVRCLRSSATITHVAAPPGRGMMAHQRPKFQETHPMLGEGSGGFVHATTQRIDLQHRIPSGDWVHEYAPKFGLGKYLVVELPHPEAGASGPLEERVERCRKAADVALEKLRQGEWENVCEELRPVWELIRNLPDVQALLTNDGYTADAAKAFNDTIKGLFELSSKFMHAVDKSGKNLVPEVRASKEDAYFQYLTAMAAINLITRKSRK